jgi:single-strand DNA-binding protein
VKGKQIYVEGRLQTRQWDDKDGNKRYTTEIRGDRVVLLGGGGGGGGRQVQRSAAGGGADEPCRAGTDSPTTHTVLNVRRGTCHVPCATEDFSVLD